jgi:hypothetical protein
VVDYCKYGDEPSGSGIADLVSPKWSLSFTLYDKYLYKFLIAHACHMPDPSHLRTSHWSRHHPEDPDSSLSLETGCSDCVV